MASLNLPPIAIESGNLGPKLDARRVASAHFVLSNNTDASVTLELIVDPKAPLEPSWFEWSRIVTLQARATVETVVQLAVPVACAGGSYEFTLAGWTTSRAAGTRFESRKMVVEVPARAEARPPPQPPPPISPPRVVGWWRPLLKGVKTLIKVTLIILLIVVGLIVFGLQRSCS